jgi:hypothetical protein
MPGAECGTANGTIFMGGKAMATTSKIVVASAEGAVRLRAQVDPARAA